jgi:RNAse (barnase) inhibitor barstar
MAGRTLEFDAAKWRSSLEIYRSFNAALGMPQWWGHSVDALLEALIWDVGTATYPASAVIIRDVANATPDVCDELVLLRRCVQEALAEWRDDEGTDFPLRFDLL